MDEEFYKGMAKVPQQGYDPQKVDNKWLKTAIRRHKEKNSLNVRFEQSNSNVLNNSCADISGITALNDDDNDDNANDEDYIPEQKKPRFLFPELDNDKMDEEYRYVRYGERSVRPEIYEVMHKLSSKYHMSKSQVEGAILEVANTLFGRKWKAYQTKGDVDAMTLPSMKNALHTESNFEALALCAIVEEIMKEDSTATIVYANDGSSLSGTGSYVVQSLTVNGTQRCLPSFGIFTETRTSLKDLEITTFKMLSAASGNKYSEQDIVSKISFVMVDSTSHNLNVIESVCEDLEVEQVPKTLVCNIHPLMMFQLKLKELCQEIHDLLGHRKISDCFMVDIEFSRESLVIKALKCLSNFINRDFSAKPWNRSSHFESFIYPKRNRSISLKECRFNMLCLCALSILHHLDDIANYLEKYEGIINGISILDRSFVDMELLKPIFATIALSGHHILNPYYQLLIDPSTKYSTLMEAFPKLYQELTNANVGDLMTLDQRFFFVDKETFKKSLSDLELLGSLENAIQLYPSEIKQMMSLALKKFARGFDIQRGAIFGFGDNAKKDTGPILEIRSLNGSEIDKLDNAPVHNLAEERSVGFLNHEISIRGKRNLEAASKKMVLNKSADLVFNNSGDFRKFTERAKQIKEIKLEWNKKMQALEKEGYAKQDLKNTSTESQKLRDLDFLKKQECVGPFTSSEEVKEFMGKVKESAAKNKRMYIEIRLQKITSKTLKKDNRLFRLKAGGKNLSTEDYADNLCAYLDQSKCISTLTLGDLHNVLTGLSGQETEVSEETSKLNSPVNVGEVIASIWYDEKLNRNKWYLGVVDTVNDDIWVSYMKQTDKVGEKWLFPEEADVCKTNINQIIRRSIDVEYHLTATIRCSISAETCKIIQTCFEETQTN